MSGDSDFNRKCKRLVYSMISSKPENFRGLHVNRTSICQRKNEVGRDPSHAKFKQLEVELLHVPSCDHWLHVPVLSKPRGVEDRQIAIYQETYKAAALKLWLVSLFSVWWPVAWIESSSKYSRFPIQTLLMVSGPTTHDSSTTFKPRHDRFNEYENQLEYPRGTSTIVQHMWACNTPSLLEFNHYPVTPTVHGGRMRNMGLQWAIRFKFHRDTDCDSEERMRTYENMVCTVTKQTVSCRE